MQTFRHMIDLLGGELSVVVSATIVRLVVAAILGGIIGLEREFRRKPAGLRTNMFICLGAAMFTVLSDVLASQHPGDHTRIAAQIIPGIGFIGAGSILHSRGSVTGLTTAATIFVVASVGMAAGGGLYLTAVFATGLILIALAVLGKLERNFSKNAVLRHYEVVGPGVESMIDELNDDLEEEQLSMHELRVARAEGETRVQFSVTASPAQHKELTNTLYQSKVFSSVSAGANGERE